MLLSDYFSRDSILRDGEFYRAMPLWSSHSKSLCYLADTRFVSQVNQNPCISAVVTSPELANSVFLDKAVAVDREPPKAYYTLHNYLINHGLLEHLVPDKYISSRARIHPTALIGSRVFIEDDVTVGPNCVVEDDTILRAGTYIGPNVVLGAHGMQNLRIEGRRFEVLYCGGVTIGLNCEVLAGAVVQKPYQAFFTEIGDNTQISVGTSIGHGSRIGRNCQIAGGVTIAGNVIVGDSVFFGPGAAVADGLMVASGSRILIGSIVGKSIYKEGQIVSGNFAQDHSKQLKNFAKIRKL